jgi:hypothetical protein
MMPPAHVSVEAWEEEGRVIKGIRLLAPLRVALVVDRWPAPLHFPVVVPEGYLSDGASVPRILWRLLSPPIDPITLTPSIVHDWLYDHGSALGLTRIEADEWYADALYSNGYAAWRTMLTYVGVRLGGGSRWTS